MLVRNEHVIINCRAIFKTSSMERMEFTWLSYNCKASYGFDYHESILFIWILKCRQNWQIQSIKMFMPLEMICVWFGITVYYIILKEQIFVLLLFNYKQDLKKGLKKSLLPVFLFLWWFIYSSWERKVIFIM